MDWSDQQKDIFQWFEQPNVATRNLVVRARAGTGKTTTILEGVNRAPESSILLAAFNKRIADELATRLSNPNSTAKTLHSVGFAAVRRCWSVQVAQRTERADALTARCTSGSTPDYIRSLVSKLHTRARECLPYTTDPTELVDLAYEMDCVPDHDTTPAGFDLTFITQAACQAMALAANERPVGGIDFADMIYLPLRNQWLVPQYELTVIDEAQDMTVAQLDLALGVTTSNGRIAVVGDDKQAIYAFRGADSNSIDRLKSQLFAKELPLNTTYRCASTIVTEAQRLVPDFFCPTVDTYPVGTVNDANGLEELLALAQPNDFILSRKNAPLARVALTFIRAQKRVRIEGRDIGAGLKALTLRLRAKSIPEFLDKLSTWESKEEVRLTAAHKPYLIDAAHDKAETLRVLSEGTTGPNELIARIEGLFSDYGTNMVICSSVHKAKGLEADNVFVLQDTFYASFGKDRQEEANIEYVAITRARTTLTRVHNVK